MSRHATERPAREQFLMLRRIYHQVRIAKKLRPAAKKRLVVLLAEVVEVMGAESVRRKKS